MLNRGLQMGVFAKREKCKEDIWLDKQETSS